MNIKIFCENTNEWEGWNQNLNFSNWIAQIFYFALVKFLQIHHTQQLFQQTFTYYFLFSEYYTWEFNCSLWVRYPTLATNLLLLTRYTCRKIVISSMFLFIENADKWKGLISIPIFSIESSNSFTLFLFNILQIHDTNNLFQTNFYTSFYI